MLQLGSQQAVPRDSGNRVLRKMCLHDNAGDLRDVYRSTADGRSRPVVQVVPPERLGLAARLLWRKPAERVRLLDRASGPRGKCGARRTV